MTELAGGMEDDKAGHLDIKYDYYTEPRGPMNIDDMPEEIEPGEGVSNSLYYDVEETDGYTLYVHDDNLGGSNKMTFPIDHEDIN